MAVDERGYIMVNERLETSVPGIYAIGDVTGGFLLAHVASHEGLVAADNILGGNRERDLRYVPMCVYGLPELARVGLTEDDARDEGFRPVTGTFRFGALGKALALGEGQGYVQLVADHDRQAAGCGHDGTARDGRDSRSSRGVEVAESAPLRPDRACIPPSRRL